MGRFLLGALLALLAMPAFGQTAEAVRKQVELSMVVTGSVDIDADGRVEHYALDQPEKLPPAIVQLVSASLPSWKFAPELVDGKPVGVHTKMTLRFIANPKGADYVVSIKGVNFWGGVGEDGAPVGERLSVRNKTSMDPLVKAIMSSGATGDVYVALKIGPDGKVIEGIVEQVNLTASGTEEQMARARKLLGESTLKVVRRWTFNVPAAGEYAGQPYWSGILPFKFRMFGQRAEPAYGHWEAYFPGPRATIPWRDPVDDEKARSDALPEGVPTLDDSGPKLLTPLTQG